MSSHEWELVPEEFYDQTNLKADIWICRKCRSLGITKYDSEKNPEYDVEGIEDCGLNICRGILES